MPKSIKEILARKAEIKNLLTAEDADIDALETEIRELNDAEAELRTKQAKRESLLNSIANEDKENVMKPIEAGLGSMEYRKAFMDYVQNGTVSDILKFEERANAQGTSTDLGVLLPETIVQEIMTELEGVYGGLYSRVRKMNIKGGVKFPIGAFSATFKRITETTVSDRQNPGGVTGTVSFTYNIGEIRIARTLLQSVLSVEAFEREVAKTIVSAYVQAMDKEIVNGVAANNECEGIITEAKKTTGSRIATDHIITFDENEIADWTKWESKLFAEIPIAMEGEKPEFVFAKQTYVSNLVTLKDSNGQPIKKAGFDVTDKQFKFNEYPVLRVEKDIFKDFDSASAGDYFGMFWVPNKAYAINTNMEFTVVHYFDHETNQYVDKALVINDGKVLDPEYIYLLKKAAVTKNS